MILWACALVALTDLNSAPAEQLIREGLTAAYANDFASAEQTFGRLAAREPANPAGHFFLAALDQLYMVDFATGAREQEFYDHLARSERACRAVLARESNPWAELYLGAGAIYRSTYEGWRKRYWRALRAGLASRAPLVRALQLDPGLYDAYLGLGVYEYFAGRIRHYALNLVPFGNIDRGLGWMRLAADRGRYYNVTALTSLVWALAEAGRGAEAVAVAEQARTRYPACRTLLWHLGLACLAARDWPRSIAVHRELLARVEREQPGNWANIAQIKLRIAQACRELGRRAEAEQLVGEIRTLARHRAEFVGMDATLRETDALARQLAAGK